MKFGNMATKRMLTGDAFIPDPYKGVGLSASLSLNPNVVRYIDRCLYLIHHRGYVIE